MSVRDVVVLVCTEIIPEIIEKIKTTNHYTSLKEYFLASILIFTLL